MGIKKEQELAIGNFFERLIGKYVFNENDKEILRTKDFIEKAIYFYSKPTTIPEEKEVCKAVIVGGDYPLLKRRYEQEAKNK